MWKILVLKVCRLGLMIPLWAALGTITAQDSIGDPKESAYAALMKAPKHGPLLDAVLATWIDAEGFDALRAHLQTRTEREDLSANEHAALGLLWRRLYEPVAALAQWEKATAGMPDSAAFWLERADLEIRLQRRPEALASLRKIVRPTDLEISKKAVRLLAQIVQHSGDQSGRQLLDQWMNELPNEVGLWLELTDLLGRFSGSEKQWLGRLAQWRETVKDQTLLSKIRLHEYLEWSQQGKWQEAYAGIRAALEAAAPDSAEEAYLLPIVTTLFERTVHQSPPLQPSALELARAQLQRPALVLTLARVLHERGEVDEALDLLKDLAEARPNDRRISEAQLFILVENGRRDEALALLASKPAADPVSLALMLRDHGRLEEAGQALADVPASDRVLTLRALFAGDLLPFPAKALPVPPSTPAPPEWKQEMVPLAPPERARRLFELWKNSPSDQEIATTLIQTWVSVGRRAEADHLFLVFFNRLESSEAKRAWCQRCASPDPVSGMNFDFSRALLSAGEGLLDEADFWFAVAELTAWQGGRQTEALMQAAGCLQGDAALAAQLEAAEGALEHQLAPQAVSLATALLGSPQDAAARLILARVDLQQGRVDQARRVVWALAEDPAMTAPRAMNIAVELLHWHEASEAAAFLALQQQRFPNDLLLRLVHLQSLRQTKQTEAWLETLLAMGSAAITPPIPQPDKLTGAAADLQALYVALNGFDEMLKDTQQLFSRTGGRRRLPIDWFARGPGDWRHWAIAQLLRYAEEQGLDNAARRTLAERAQQAGLPLASTLVWLRVDLNQPHSVSFRADFDALESQPFETWTELAAQLFQQRFANRQDSPLALSEQESRLLKKLTEALQSTQPQLALTLSLSWWRHHPESAAARSALSSGLAALPDLPGSFAQTLQSYLQGLTYEQRRDSLWQETSTTLTAWLATRDQADEGFAATAYAASQCFLMLGAWQPAAAWAERAWPLLSAPGLVQAAPVRQPNQPPPWIYWQNRSLLTWPPQFEAFQLAFHPHLLAPSPQPTAAAQLVRETDRADFLAAGANLKIPSLRLLWLLLGDDQAAAKSLVREWHQTEPESAIAMRLAASLANVEGQPEVALDLLHSLTARLPADSEEQRLAQLVYLQAALVPTSYDPFTSRGSPVLSPPFASHQERVRQILLVFLPELEKWPHYRESWLAAFKAAGLEELTAPWRQVQLNPPRNEESYESPRLLGSRESRSQQQLLMGFTPQRVQSHEVGNLLDQGKTKQALTLLVRGLKAEADQHLLRPGATGSEWSQLIARDSVKQALLATASDWPRQRLRELNQALHLASVCEAWQTVIDWADEASDLVAAHPYLQSQVDLAKLELGTSIAEIARQLKTGPINSQRERFQQLMSPLQANTNFQRRLKLAELFITLISQSPPPAFLQGEGSSHLFHNVFQALTRSYSLPQNGGVVPPLYPELDSQPPKALPASISQADLDRRKQLHARLCTLVLENPDWQKTSLNYLIQRHLVEGEPTAEVLKERLLTNQRDAFRSSYLQLDQLAQLGRDWRDVGLRLRLAKLLMDVLATPAPPPTGVHAFQPPRAASIDNLLLLIGGEVQAAAFPPLWALWEYPLNVDGEKRAYTAEQKAWNQQRNEVFTELATWALDQPAYRASIAPRWANYRLFSPGTDEEVLTQIRRLRDQPGDPFVLNAFVQSAQLAYDNEHHIRASEVAVTLLKEMAPEQRDPNIASQLFQLLSHGRSNQAEAMPSLELAPEAIVPATHRLTADLQRRRLAVIEELSGGMDLSVLPPTLLLWRLTKAVKETADTKAIEDALIAIGKANPELLNAPLKEYVENLDPSSNIAFVLRLQRALLQIGEGYVDQAVASKQSPQWLERIAKPFLPRPDYHIDPLPHPSGQLNHPDPYLQVPIAWADLPPEITGQRREIFLRALAVCARDPKLRLQTLGERLVNDLTHREKWPELFERLREEMQKDFYSEGALIEWLQWEQSYFSLERVSAATDFLIQWSQKLDTFDPQSSHHWLRNAHTLYVRYPSKGLDPREYVSLAPPDSPLSPSRPIGFVAMAEHEEPAKKLRGEWLRLIEHASLKPAALLETFYLLTQAYLETDPRRLVSLAQKLTEEELTKGLEPLLQRARHSHIHVPLKFRLALAEFILLFPGVAEGSKPALNQPMPPTIPLDVLREYIDISVSPYDSLSPTLLAQIQDPSLLSRRQALLDQIDQLAARDERLVAANRVAKLLDSLAQRPPTAEEIEKVLADFRTQPVGVLKSFEKVAEPKTRFPSQFTEDERLALLNQAELMVSVIERWPGPLDDSAGQWFFKLLTLLGPYPNTQTEHFNRIANLQERLMEVAAANEALIHSSFQAYADACCLSAEGTERLTRRINALVKKSPATASHSLSVWLSNSYPSSLRPIEAEVRGLTLCRDLLRDWPERSIPETQHWPQSVLKWSLHGDLALFNSRFIGAEREQTISPTPTSNRASRALIGEMLDLLQKRPAGAADWLVPARLRHSARLGLTPAELADVLKPFFQPPLKTQTLAYFATVIEHRMPPGHYFRHPSLQGEVVLPRMEELRDILRCLTAAAHSEWLPEAELNPLIDQVRSAESRFLNEVVTSQRPYLEVRGLAEEFKTLAAQRFRKPPLVLLRPADLAAYIQSNLIQEAALPELMERVWQTLENSPALGAAALKTWAEAINKDTYHHAYLDGGKLAKMLLDRWKADWPTPDWAVVFLRNWRLHGWKEPRAATSTWSAEDRAFVQLHSELRQPLQTRLMAFPTCLEEDYFVIVVATPYGLPVPTDPKVVALAEAVVKNRLSSGRLPAVLPEHAPVSTTYRSSGKRSSPLSSPLWSPTETWVLLEHSLRQGREPAIDALLDVEAWPSDAPSKALVESLKGLFFEPVESFVSHAVSFRAAAAAAKMKQDPFLWVLRIALLRELALTWKDLRIMAPPSKAGTALGMLAAPQDSALQYWMLYLHERGEYSFVEDLVSYCRDIAAGSSFEMASAAPVNLGTSIVNLRAIKVPQKPFLSAEWNRVWESLITAAQVAATWPSVVTAAGQLGFLENSELAACFATVRSNDSWTYQEPAAWLSSLQPTGLNSSNATLAPLWFRADEGPAWLWQLASLLDDGAKPAALAELARLQSKQPTLGRALLRLALLASRSTLSPEQLNQELSQVLSQINGQPAPLRLAVLRSLHGQSPRLSESIATAPDGSLLQSLALPAHDDAPSTEVGFWLSDTPPAEGSTPAGQIILINKLGGDLRKLVLSDHSQSSAVFFQGLDHLLRNAPPDQRTHETRNQFALNVLSRLVSNQPTGAASNQTTLTHKTTSRNRISLVGFATAHLPEEAVHLGMPGSQLETGLYFKFVCLNLPQQHQLDGRAIAHEMLYLANAQRPEAVLASFPHFRDLMLQLPPGVTQQFLDTLREFAGQDRARLTLLWGFEQTLALLRGPTAEEVPWPAYLTERVRDPACPPLIRYWLAQAAPQQVTQFAPEALFTAAQDCLSSEKASTARLYLAKLDLRPIVNLSLSATAAQALDRFVTSFSDFVTGHTEDPTLRTTPEKAAVLDVQVFQPMLQKLTGPTHAPRRAALIKSLAEAGLLPLKLIKQEWETGTDPTRFHLRLPSKPGLSTQLPIINELPAVSAQSVTRLQGLADSNSPLPLRSLQHLLLAGPDSLSEPPPPDLAHAQRLAAWKPSFAADPELARDVLWHLSRSDWFTEAALPLMEELKALRDFHSNHQHLTYPADRFSADLSLLCYHALLNWRERRDASALLRVLERRVITNTSFTDTYLDKYLAQTLRTGTPAEWAKELPLLVEILESRFSATLHPMVAHTFVTIAAGFSEDPVIGQLQELLEKVRSLPRLLPQPDATRELLQALASRTDLPLALRLQAVLPPHPMTLADSTPFDQLLLAQSLGVIDAAELAQQIDAVDVSKLARHLYSLARWLQWSGQNEAALRLIARIEAEVPASDMDDPLTWAYVAEICHHAQQPDLLQVALERAVPRDSGSQPTLLYHLIARLKWP